MFKYNISIFFILVIYPFNIFANTSNNGQTKMTFDIKNFEYNLNQYNKGQNSFEINKKGNIIIKYYKDDDGYGEITTKSGILNYNRYYYLSGALKSEQSSFYSIRVFSWKTYNINGKLEWHHDYTPEDWVNKLVTKVKEIDKINLWTPYIAEVTESIYKGKKVIKVIHLKGEPLSYWHTPQSYFSLFDFVSLNLIAQGEIRSTQEDLSQTPKKYRNSAPPKEIRNYFINGKQVNLPD